MSVDRDLATLLLVERAHSDAVRGGRGLLACVVEVVVDGAEGGGEEEEEGGAHDYKKGERFAGSFFWEGKCDKGLCPLQILEWGDWSSAF